MLTSSQINHLLNNVIHRSSNTENQVRVCSCDTREFMRLITYSPEGMHHIFSREETNQILQARDSFVSNSSPSFRARVNQARVARMARTMCRG